MASFLNKVVLITGASSGIGAATAVEFAKRGASLALTGRRRKQLEEVSEACQKEGVSGDKILVTTGDITKEEDVEKVFKDTIGHFGGLHTLVNNAGYGAMSDIENTDLKVLDDQFNVHGRTVYHLCKLAVPFLKLSKGNIVNVSSLVTNQVMSGVMPYTLGKAAMEVISKHLAGEMGQHGVRVNAISPGAVRTEIFNKGGFVSTTEEANQMFDEMAQGIPLGRVARPDEIAKAIVFLASEDASFITGINMIIDGGESVRPAGMEGH